MISKIEEAKKILENDLENNPSSLSDPIGDARTYHKILNYLFICIEEKTDKADIADWLYKLYRNQTDKEKDSFSSRIDLLIGALIRYNSYINKQLR